MKIISIKATPVNIPMDIPYFWGDAGICTAAYLHMVAATEWIHEPSQSLFRWQTDDIIEEGPFRQTNNVIPVPEGPGLGVTLSPEGFKRCHERFLKTGWP